MQHELRVKSTVIDWPEQAMTITTTSGEKHTISLETTITVTMLGYPARETKTMHAHDLNPYMMRGYIIEQIAFEEGEGQHE